MGCAHRIAIPDSRQGRPRPNSGEPVTLTAELTDAARRAVELSPWAGLDNEPYIPDTEAERFEADLLPPEVWAAPARSGRVPE